MLTFATQFVTFTVLISFAFAQNPPAGCHICNSRDNPTCIDPDESFQQSCLGVNENFACFTRVLFPDGHVERGCLNQLNGDERTNCNSNTCRVCLGINNSRNGSYCNVGRFPEHRIRCVTCRDNTTCFGNEGNVADLHPVDCLRFRENDRCFTRRIDNSTYERGCLSSTTGCELPHCTTCDGDGCNHKAFNASSFVQINLFTLLIAIITICMVRN